MFSTTEKMIGKGDNLWVNGSSGRRTKEELYWLGCTADEVLHV